MKFQDLKARKAIKVKDKIGNDKVSLPTNLEGNPSHSSFIFLLDVNFENLIVKLHFLYVVNTHVKFQSNKMLFTIQSINLFFMHNYIP